MESPFFIEIIPQFLSNTLVKSMRVFKASAERRSNIGVCTIYARSKCCIYVEVLYLK